MTEQTHVKQDEIFLAKNPIKKGLISLLIFFVIFLFWAIFAPINSASIADGTIVLDFNRKTIQHLEGGIIDEILVKEGQMVKQGDVLLYLHDIKAKSEQQILKKRLWAMNAQKQRLLAEKNVQTLDLTAFFSEIANFSKEDQQELSDVLNNQIHLYKARQEQISGELKVLNEKYNSNIALAASSSKKLAILRKELKMIRPLVKENNLPLSRKYDLEKQISETSGLLSQYTSESQAALKQIDNYKNEDLAKVLDSLKETELEIVNLSNQLSSAKDVLSRSEILSPVDGKVMNMKFHTIGAVVPPAGEIMNIVPQNDELIIEAKVKPQDIDEVRAGLKAKVSLTAYKGKKVPKLDAEVLDISADIVFNEATKESYFLARVRIGDSELQKLKAKVELYPGMPAQVFIITGSRSLISYLFTPIEEAAYKAFRES